MQRQYLEPTTVRELTGGRYDGDFRVIGNAPCCGERVGHIMEAGNYGGIPEYRSCNAGCGARNYVLVRPMPGLMGQDYPWWKPSTGGLNGIGFSGGNGLSLLGGV